MEKVRNTFKVFVQTSYIIMKNRKIRATITNYIVCQFIRRKIGAVNIKKFIKFEMTVIQLLIHVYTVALQVFLLVNFSSKISDLTRAL